MRSFALLAALCACSPSATTNDGGVDGGGGDAGPYTGPDYASGTRLRAELFASADGATQWHGWYDKQFDAECTYVGASDGTTRCLPGDVYVANSYADASCTQPLAARATCLASPAKYIVDYTTECAADVYLVGTNLGALTTVYSNPGCVPLTTNGETYFTIGAKADITAFVKGTLERDPRGPDVSMQFTVGDDGSRQPRLPYDLSHKGTCATMPSTVYTPNGDRCVPQHVAFFEFEYSDPGCSAKVAINPFNGGCNPASDDVASSAFVYENVKCQGTALTSIAQLGLQTSGTLYSGSPTACNVLASGPANWYPINAPIDVTTLPAIATTHVGQGRIAQSWQTSASQDRLFVEQFFDTTLDKKCKPRTASDGVLRCVPSATSVTAAFADDKCTMPVLQWGSQTGCPPTSPPPAVSYGMTLGCVDQTVYAQTGAKIATPTMLYQWNGACDVISVSPTIDYYAMIIVDPTTLAQLTDSHE